MEHSYRDELYHHGILGQKWGKRNGPPYPLDASDHSVSEKKAGWKKSLAGGVDGKTNKNYNKINLHLTSNQKKALIIGASVVGIGIAAYGVYKLGRIDASMISNGKNVADNYLEGKGSSPVGKIGKSIDEVDLKMVKRINAKNRLSPGGHANCFHTTTSYILNSMFGQNTTALPFDGIDEMSGMAGHGRDYRIFNSIFNGLETRECDKSESMSDMFKSIKNGSTGVIHIRSGASGHYINYEKTLDGKLTIIDPQINAVTDTSMYISSGRYSPFRVIDFSNATIKSDAKETLQYIVGGYK